MSQGGLDKFEYLVCGGEGSNEGSNDEYSPETMCYFFNYERFAHHEAGPDDGDVPTIMPTGFQFDDDVDNGVDMCVISQGDEEVDRIPCDCSNPREFMKNMLNKDVCEEAKKVSANPPEEIMSQAGLDNFESLVCGFQTNFLSFGLILL